MTDENEFIIEVKYEVDESNLVDPLEVAPSEVDESNLIDPIGVAPSEVDESNLVDPLEVAPSEVDESNLIDPIGVAPSPNEVNDDNDDELNLEVVPHLNAASDRQTKQNELIIDADNINGKINIALNVLEVCKEEAILHQQISGALLDKLEYFTKLPLHDPVVIDVLREKYENRSLIRALEETKPLPQSVLPFVYNDIRDIFIEYYVKRRQIPTLTNLMTSLKNLRDDSFYKSATIRTLVKNQLVDYHHLPTLHRYIINENPKLAYQRHLYLRQIVGYRSQGKSIVYVTVLKIPANKCLGLAVSSTAGLIAKSDCFCDAEDGDKVGNDNVRSWIQSELLPVLSPNVVVVLKQPRKNIATVTPYSKKETMIKWLQERDIPFDDESHKSDLYKLFKIHSKKKNEPGFYENIFASNGFKVLVCLEYPKLIFLHDIWSKVAKSTSNVSFTINKMLKDLSHIWALTEENVIEEEKQMMKDDEEMGTIIDNLLEMVKNGDIQAEEFPEGCFGTKAGNFDIHIGDILID